MTDFFTHCWKSARRESLAAWLLVGVLAMLAWQDAHAQQGSEVTQLRLERTADGLVLYANVRLELPAAVQDALTKGIALVFLAEADLVRHRWYWSDKKIASAQRHMRLAYHPLTRAGA